MSEKAAARVTDKHTCPMEGHKGGPIDPPAGHFNGSPDVETEGQPQARVLDQASCEGTKAKDYIVTGSSTVESNGLPVARIKDQTHHGWATEEPKGTCGEITTGASNVEIGGETIRVHFIPKDETVHLTDRLKVKLIALSQRYYNKTQKDLIVTDGERNATDQATAMYPHMTESNWLAPYHNKTAINEIKKAYDAGVAAGDDKNGTIGRMSAIIQRQYDDGMPLSEHLYVDDAADVGLSDLDQSAFNSTVQEDGTFTSFKHGNNHFHMQIKK